MEVHKLGQRVLVNGMTLARPIFAALSCGSAAQGNRELSLAFAGLSVATELDGSIARKTGIDSKYGGFFDCICDGIAIPLLYATILLLTDTITPEQLHNYDFQATMILAWLGSTAAGLVVTSYNYNPRQTSNSSQ